MLPWFNIINYLKYLLRANTVRRIHSPFLFRLYGDVFRDRSEYPVYQRQDAYKKQLLSSPDSIEFLDLGTGGKNKKTRHRRISEIARTSSKRQKYARLLFRLVHYFQPALSVELGTSLGLSTVMIAGGAPEGKVITVEGCPSLSSFTRQRFDEFGLENIRLINGDFGRILPEILEQERQVGFIFIDGNHTMESTIFYFDQVVTGAGNDTLIVIDDIHWSPGMEKAWNYIVNHERVTLCLDIFSMGLVFLRKELAKEHFILRF